MSSVENILQVDILTDQGVFKSLKSSDKELILGREKNCHIWLNDINISRAHLKIAWSGDEVNVIDLGSSNGTYVNKHRLTVGYINKVFPSDEIKLGNSIYKLKLVILTHSKDKMIAPVASTSELAAQVTDKPASEVITSPQPIIPESIVKDAENIADEIKFLKIEDKINAPDSIELNFKNIGLNLPKYNTPVDHANEIIREAEYIKSSMLKAAEVKKDKLIHQAKVEAMKIINEKYDEYQAKANNLILQTKAEITKLKYESEILNKEKEQQTLEEIKQDWKNHQEQISVDLQLRKNQIEKENALNAELFMEKVRVEIMTEKNKILSDAEHEVLKKKREVEDFIFQERKKHTELLAEQAQTQSEQLFKEKKRHTDIIDQERRDHDAKIIKELNEHNLLITNLKADIESYKTEHLDLHNLIKSSKVEKESLLEDIVKFSKEHSESESKLNYLKSELEKYTEDYKKVTSEIFNFSTTKKELEESILALSNEYKNLQDIFKSLSEKNIELKNDYNSMLNQFEELKKDKKKEIDTEMANLRKVELAKFDDFKTQQAQSYQKIKDSHIESIKKISIDLSQEIATKIELLNKSNPVFNFEKTLEVVNFVLQVKSAQFGGGSAQHNEQLDVWKKRQQSEKRSIYYQTFAVYMIVSVIGYFLYGRLSIDPVERKLRELASERQRQVEQNVYIPNVTSEYKNSYVDNTLSTENFYEKYSDEELQQAFITSTSRHFLRRWKVNEEAIIKVVSGSRAFVQDIKERSQKLTKTNYKVEIEKMRQAESELIQQHEEILGSKVRYEDYKKLESEYFKGLLN